MSLSRDELKRHLREKRRSLIVAACMAAQYAGWQISRDGYFAMGSGPMRAAAAKEELFQHIGYVERAEAASDEQQAQDTAHGASVAPGVPFA